MQAIPQPLVRKRTPLKHPLRRQLNPPLRRLSPQRKKHRFPAARLGASLHRHAQPLDVGELREDLLPAVQNARPEAVLPPMADSDQVLAAQDKMHGLSRDDDAAHQQAVRHGAACLAEEPHAEVVVAVQDGRGFGVHLAARLQEAGGDVAEYALGLCGAVVPVPHDFGS
ncbi:hypothetical protein OPT61_g8121 [Boeremia exigua]|uniref:Uncharacterized protein n=1 Tax=Boeremia exigua TaxID=749465 RepID=A0ACC2I0N2_9PLEO|nr:hypothetical protein OPT61_g8121 [Boeremia exigua]